MTVSTILQISWIVLFLLYLKRKFRTLSWIFVEMTGETLSVPCLFYPILRKNLYPIMQNLMGDMLSLPNPFPWLKNILQVICMYCWTVIADQQTDILAHC